MAHYLYKVQEAWGDANSVTLGDGIRMSALSAHPEGDTFTQGIHLELRFPNGFKHRTFLLNFGVAVVREDDGSFLIEEDPYLRLTLPADLRPEDVPVGTEIWWLNEEVGKSEEEISILLAKLYE